VTGAIDHVLLLAPALPPAMGGGALGDDIATASASCRVAGNTSTSLRFTVPADTPVSVRTVVRISRDPSCVARIDGRRNPLCGLSTDVSAAAAKIQDDAKAVTLAQAQSDHGHHWQAFWNVSKISLPQAPETERFWYGALYVLNSAIPHAGQEQTPPGLYGPWGSHDNPGWHGDFTIDVSVRCVSSV
jgi:hypothetical protein